MEVFFARQKRLITCVPLEQQGVEGLRSLPETNSVEGVSENRAERKRKE